MKIKFGLIMLLYGVFVSCNFLEYDRLSDLTDIYVFTQYENAEKILTDIYGNLPSGYNNISGAMLASAGDEAEHAHDYSSIQKFNTGTWNKYSNPDYPWENCYASVRKANLYLEYSVGLEELIYEEWRWVSPETYFVRHWNLIFYEAEARFLRAFNYFELMKRYGDIPIVNYLVDLNSDLNVSRSPVKDVVKAIAEDCHFAARVLLPSWNVKINNEGEITPSGNMDMSSRSGRPTSGAAYALLAKAYLYAASPLHNNGQYDKALCDSAARYTAKVIKMPEHELHSDYAELFKTGTTYYNELIFEKRSGDNNSFEKYNYPVGYDQGGQGATCPSLNLANAYEMTDGTQFDWNNPVHAADPFNGRDPRFEATFLCNGQEWQGRPVESWDDGLDGLYRERGTKTGFYLRKYVDPDLNLVEDKKSRHLWYFIRLADVYLMFAEAANEVVGPDQNLYGYTARGMLNAVRERVNMPPVSDFDPLVFRVKVRHERQVELAFEESRHWDVRRWKIGKETFGSDLMGLEIIPLGDRFVYTPRLVEKRVYEDYMDLYPIPESEILKTGMRQNPGW